MILYVNSEGNITAISPSTINQGSIDVNTITIIAPMPSTASCFVAYKLPNGLVAKPQFADNAEDAATLLEDFSGKFNTTDGTQLNAWQTAIKRPITERSGALSIQVFFVDASGRALTTSTVEQPINQGIDFIYPDDPEENVWTEVLRALSDAKVSAYSAKTSAQNAATSAQNAAQSANIAIEYAFFDVVIRGDVNSSYDGANVSDSIAEKTSNFSDVVLLLEDISLYQGGIVIPNNVKSVYVRNLSLNLYTGEGYYFITQKFDEGSNLTLNDVTCELFCNGSNLSKMTVEGFARVDGVNCGTISFCKNISNSNCDTMSDCSYISTTNVAQEHSDCTYIDPFTTSGFTPDNSYNKSVAVGENGETVYLDPPTVDMTYSDNTLSISVTHGGKGSTETVELPFSTVFDYKGSRATFEDLPETGTSTGDVYNIQNPFEIDGKDYPADTNVVWDGANWDALGGTVDLSGYLEKPSENTNVASLLGVTNNGNTVYYAFTAEKTANTIAQRDSNGELSCNTPTNPNSAVNLSFFNDAIGDLVEILEILHSGGTV